MAKLEEADIIYNSDDLLFKTLQIIRKDIDASDYYIVLFFMLLARSNYFSGIEKIGTESVKQQLHDSIVNDKRLLSDSIRKVYYQISNIIDRLSEKTIYELIRLYRDKYYENLKINFTNYFENTIYALASQKHSISGEYLLPLNITKFMCMLAEPLFGHTVYNPYAGLGSFAYYIRNIRYFGQESNKMVHTIGLMRSIAHLKHTEIANFTYDLDDSITNWNPNNQKYDIVISSPPMGQIRKMGSDDRPFKDIESDFIQMALGSIVDYGVVITLVPNNFFYSHKTYNIRKQLVDKNLIDKIIALPKESLFNTNVATSILVIRERRYYEEWIQYVDTSNYFNSELKGRKEVDFSEIANLILTNEQNPIIKEVHKDEIIKNDYNLSFQRFYLQYYDGTPLKSFCEIINGENPEKGTIGKFVNIIWLSESSTNFKIDISQIHEGYVPKDCSEIKETCILVALAGLDIRATLFEFENTPIFISNDILAFRVSQSIAKTEFIVSELYSSSVLEQINVIARANILQRINKDDFVNIRIKIPSLDEQSAIIVNRKHDFIIAETERLERLKSELGINIADENSYLRHRIRGTIRNARKSLLRIVEIIENLSGEEKTKVLESRNIVTNKTYDQYLKILIRDVESIYCIINDASIDIRLKDFKKDDFDIYQFIEEYCLELQDINDKIFNFNYKVDLDIYPFNSPIEFTIKGDRKLLKDALDNLIENAEKHAFKNSYNANNEIVISWTYDFDRKFFIIEISNTGDPFPNYLSFDNAIRKGTKGGDVLNGNGFGLYFVNEVLRIHNGNFSLIRDGINQIIFPNAVSCFIIEIPCTIKSAEYNEKL